MVSYDQLAQAGLVFACSARSVRGSFSAVNRRWGMFHFYVPGSFDAPKMPEKEHTHTGPSPYFCTCLLLCVVRPTMAHDNEGRGKEHTSHAAADDDGAAAAAHVGGADHDTSSSGRGPPHAPASTAGKAQRDRDSIGHGHADDGKALKIGIYGMVNAMMAIPILYGYAAIIFRCVRVCLCAGLLAVHGGDASRSAHDPSIRNL